MNNIKSLKINEVLIKTTIELTRKDILDLNQINDIGIYTNPNLREYIIDQIAKNAKEKL
jgi:hypothetical protein